jgi:hypothetical protein
MKLIRHEHQSNRFALVIAIWVASFLLSAANANECQVAGGPERLDGDKYVAATMTTGAAGCFRIFHIGKAIKHGIVLKGVVIVDQPQNGSLIQPSKSSFDYKPKAGFKGQDKFSLKICGQENGRSGCVTVGYGITVH